MALDMTTEPERVIDDNGTENKADGKDVGGDAVPDGDSGAERGHKGAVRAGYAPGCNEVVRAHSSVPHRVEHKLEQLTRNLYRDCGNKYLRKPFHTTTYRL